jgi:hypothetical protein
MKKLFIATLSIILMASCSNNGRYVPFSVQGHTETDLLGESYYVSGGIYYMDTQTGEYFIAKMGKKKTEKE